MKNIILYVMIILLTASLYSRDDQRNRYGLYGHYIISLHSSDFKTLPGVNCCGPGFKGGTGSGFDFGALFETPVANNLFLGIRAGYFQDKMEFKETETTTVGLMEQNGLTKAVPGEIEYILKTSLSAIELQPMLQYQLFGMLNLHLGLNLQYLLSKTYNKSEPLVKPETGTFSNNERIWLPSSGDIKEANDIQIGLLAGASGEIALNQQKEFLLGLEAFYTHGFTKIVKDVDWIMAGIRFGLSLKYSPAKKTAPREIRQVAGKRYYYLAADVKALGINPDSTTGPVAIFQVEEFISRQVYPLLPYVFFSENSDEIPPRYVYITPEDTRIFNENSRFLNTDALTVYYDLLNIVGKRMLENPSANLTLTGCNADIGSERDNTKLSQSRAEKVKNYLRDRWNIAESRMTVKSRNLPEKETKNLSPVHYQENRRVEIVSDNPEITRPLLVFDTLRIPTPPALKFLLDIKSDTSIARWTLTSVQKDDIGEKVLFQKTGYSFSDADSVYRWNVERDRKSIPRTEKPIDFTLAVTNIMDSSAISQGSIPVKQITIQKKRKERIADLEIDEYRLILFDYDSPDLNAQHKALLDFVCKNTKPDSKVIIKSFTDQLGPEQHNKDLSIARGNAVESAFKCNLRSVEMKAYGESDMYDNSVPEGRFYCRTVVIRVETPVK